MEIRLRKCNNLWQNLWFLNFKTALSLQNLFVYSTVKPISDECYPY